MHATVTKLNHSRRKIAYPPNSTAFGVVYFEVLMRTEKNDKREQDTGNGWVRLQEA